MTTATAPAAGRTSVLRRNRDFRLLWMGQALSGFGSSMSAVALPLVLLAAGQPATSVAVISTAVAVTGLAVRIPAGLLSDRHDQRGLLVGCDLVRVAAVGAVALYVLTRPLPLWLALAVVVVSAGAAEVFKPAQFRLVRRVVSPEQIPAAMAMNQARAYGAGMAGPAAGGLLVGVWPALPFAVDAVTFLASALCITAMTRTARARATGATGTTGATEATGQAPGFWARLTAGFRHLAHDRFLRRSTLFFSGLTVVFSMFGSALLLGVGREPGGAAAVGWAFSTAALAGLLGSLAAPRLLRLLPLPVLVATGPAVAAVLLIAAWLGGSVLVFVAAFSAMSLLVPAINAAVVSVMATSIPEEIYGRVTTANDFVVQLLQPLAPLAAGALLVTCSLPVTALVLGGCLLALALLALALPTPEPARTGDPEPTRSDA
ncbi:MFS transporter [Streptomyces sp. NPDC026672]|uniref:MFS transporter n=1 Tax=unclassified Streptomyces TaxID=2593676 RepID=UPI0033F866C3